MLNSLRAHCVRKGPHLLRFPLRMTPFSLKKPLIQGVLRWQFQQALADGELDFLEGRWLGIEVSDLALSWSVTVDDGKLNVAERSDCDVWFRGEANDMVLIAARRLDPDTLFFQRRLQIEGDTELGLEVKNLMDAIDIETMPTPIRLGLVQMADFIEAGLREDATSSPNRAGISC